MKFHFRSYGIGVGTGLLIFIVFIVFKSLFFSTSQINVSADNYMNSEDRARQINGMIMTTERLESMAEEMGMTIEELQAEMDSGKTLPEIAKEHGVTLQGGRRMQTGSGVFQSGSGIGMFPDMPSINDSESGNAL